MYVCIYIYIYICIHIYIYIWIDIGRHRLRYRCIDVYADVYIWLWMHTWSAVFKTARCSSGVGYTNKVCMNLLQRDRGRNTSRLFDWNSSSTFRTCAAAIRHYAPPPGWPFCASRFMLATVLLREFHVAIDAAAEAVVAQQRADLGRLPRDLNGGCASGRDNNIYVYVCIYIYR